MKQGLLQRERKSCLQNSWYVERWHLFQKAKKEWCLRASMLALLQTASLKNPKFLQVKKGQLHRPRKLWKPRPSTICRLQVQVEPLGRSESSSWRGLRSLQKPKPLAPLCLLLPWVTSVLTFFLFSGVSCSHVQVFARTEYGTGWMMTAETVSFVPIVHQI
mmetsp:Transcript_45342/g.97222  ORF Transcript_45342/g.97222 Transcript_45342/m.97222 type:complete len:161 (+) Transcript_45342:1254-1736(+)